MSETRPRRTTFMIAVSVQPGNYEVILPAARPALDMFTVCTGSLWYCPHLFHHRPQPTVSRTSQALLTTLLIKSKQYLQKTSTTSKVSGWEVYHFRCKISISPAPFRTCKAVPFQPRPSPMPLLSPPTPAETTNGQAGCWRRSEVMIPDSLGSPGISGSRPFIL